MRRTFWLQDRVLFQGVALGVCAFLLAGPFSKFLHDSSTHPPVDQAFRFLLSFMGVFLVASHLVPRVVVDDDGIAVYDMLNRRQLQLRFDQIVRYLPVADTWALVSANGVHVLPRIELSELHRIMVDRAPKSLAAKRWKCGQIPPAEEFRHTLLDPRVSPQALGMLCGALIMALFDFSRVLHQGAFLIPSFWFPTIYDLKDGWGTLDLTSTGIKTKWPWDTREIAWTDVTAIFMEGPPTDRRYVLTSLQTSIVVPRRIARSKDAMRKLLYSLPDGTRCVNFNETFRKGFRKQRWKWALPRLRRAAPAGV
ncbi:hypothetical protein [Fimbriimonas ginsengisoli]|uniref:Uncharacterized protein n=1 Tax=Fimbriimonas ginsengisoli Gsoil 348 TaxID=661478 RepID=A0A068NRB5_FIMGI|nr:hypothetical protein [Fimbriimonas ginsengisoli]AIE86048.1 hypothetical protein OP10G_2680 [Fimbriimonas ginsengisoli Gsoil 348]